MSQCVSSCDGGRGHQRGRFHHGGGDWRSEAANGRYGHGGVQMSELFCETCGRPLAACVKQRNYPKICSSVFGIAQAFTQGEDNADKADKADKVRDEGCAITVAGVK